MILLKSVNNIKENSKVYKSQLNGMEFQSKILPTRIENEARAATPAEIAKKNQVKLSAGILYQRLEFKLMEIFSDEKMKNPKIFHKIEVRNIKFD